MKLEINYNFSFRNIFLKILYWVNINMHWNSPMCLIWRIQDSFGNVLRRYSMTSRLEDMQQVREILVNYDGLSNKKPDDCFFQELYDYQQYESPFKILLHLFLKTLNWNLKCLFDAVWYLCFTPVLYPLFCVIGQVVIWEFITILF